MTRTGKSAGKKPDDSDRPSYKAKRKPTAALKNELNAGPNNKSKKPKANRKGKGKAKTKTKTKKNNNSNNSNNSSSNNNNNYNYNYNNFSGESSSDGINAPIIISDDEDSASIYSISDDSDESFYDVEQNGEEDYIPLSLYDDDDDSRSGRQSDERQQATKRRRGEDQDRDAEEDDLSAFYPWWRSSRLRGLDKLEGEVNDFVDYLEPTQHEILLRHYLVHKIRYILQQTWSDAEVEVFGSFKTNTFLPDSDVDLVISIPEYPTKSTLYSISNILERHNACQGTPEVIASASVPVIKFVESLTRLKVDIILQSATGVMCADYVSDLLDQYPGARKLTLMVKHMVALRNLNEVFTGGIGGFGLVCLVISFLQMHPKVATKMIDPERHTGVLLLDFLQLYGINFAIGNVGISVKGRGSYYSQQSYCKRQNRPVFSIKDPLDSNNDIGIKSFNAVGVVKLFRKSYLSMFAKTLGKSRKSSPCMIAEIGYIPKTMVRQREWMEEIYKKQSWRDEPASSTFDWNMVV